MFWVGLAILAHVGNALVFVVDKSLLGTKTVIGQPLRYAFWSGLLALSAVIVLPFDFAWPTIWLLQWSLLAGGLHLLALWSFFYAIKSGEPSRIVPIVGSVVPIATLVIAVSILGEKLSRLDSWSVIILIIGGGLLSIRLGDTKGLGGRVAAAIMASGSLFAAYFSVMKYIYDHSETFLSVFAYSRLVEGLAALVLLGPLVYFSIERSHVKPESISWPRLATILVPVFFVGNKVLAAGAFLLQHWAIQQGSVAVVNSLQGTQYLFLLLLAIAVSHWQPRLFREEVHQVSLTQKTAGVILTGLGLFILAWA